MIRIIIITMLLPALPCLSQGLFESAQEEVPSEQNKNINLGGFIRSAAFIGNSVDKEIPYMQSMYGQLSLTTDVQAGKFGAAYADLRFRYGSEYQLEIREADLREAYIDLYAGPVDLRLGKQIVSWGSTSFINPSDQFSPDNPVLRSPDPDDLKLGNWMMNSKFSIGSGSSLQFLWIPIYRPSVLVTEPFTFPEYVEFSDPGWPVPEIRNSSFGIQYDLRSSVMDGSLSFFNGYRNNPLFMLQSASIDPVLMQPDQIILQKMPYRIQSAGLNIAIPFGNYIFRSESAWMNPEEDALLYSYTPFADISYIAEIEQSGTSITVLAGYHGKHILNFEESAGDPASMTGDFPDASTFLPQGVTVTPEIISGAVNEQVVAFNRLFDYQLKEYYHSVYASLSILMINERLTLDLPCMYNITTQELMLRPSVAYSIADGFKATAGYSYMKGTENSLYEIIGPVLNSGYISFKVLF